MCDFWNFCFENGKTKTRVELIWFDPISNIYTRSQFNTIIETITHSMQYPQIISDAKILLKVTICCNFWRFHNHRFTIKRTLHSHPTTTVHFTFYVHNIDLLYLAEHFAVHFQTRLMWWNVKVGIYLRLIQIWRAGSDWPL